MVLVSLLGQLDGWSALSWGTLEKELTGRQGKRELVLTPERVCC